MTKLNASCDDLWLLVLIIPYLIIIITFNIIIIIITIIIIIIKADIHVCMLKAKLATQGT